MNPQIAKRIEETKAELELLDSLEQHRTLTTIKKQLKTRLSTLEEIDEDES
jgi:hypothetical protein